MIPRGVTIPALLIMCLSGLSVRATAETNSGEQGSAAIHGSPVAESTQLSPGESRRGLLGRNAPINPADGAPYRAFSIDLEPGNPVRFEVAAPNTDMQPTLTLYAPDGTLIETNRSQEPPRNGEQSPALIHEPFMDGRHTLVVTGSRAGSQGRFTLSAETIEADSSLSFPGSVSGNLYQADGTHPQTQSPRVVYTFELDEVTYVDAHMQSEAFDTYLSIAPVDGDGRTYHNDDWDEEFHSRIQTRLPADEYEVWASSDGADATGQFTLSLAESSGNTPHNPETVSSFPADISGSLSQGVSVHPQTGSRRVVYSFELDDATVVDAHMQSDAFDTYLSVTPADGDGETYHNHDWGQGTNSRIQTELPPGQYQVWAGASGAGARGSFTLSLEQEIIQERESLNFPGEVSGNLYQGEASHPQTGSPRVVYTFELDEATLVDAHIQSEFFNTYLSITPANGDGQTYHNYKWGQGLNSRIRTELPAGEYEVWAASYNQHTSGSFTLSVDQSSLQEQEALTAGDERSLRIDDTMLRTMPAATRGTAGVPLSIRVEEHGRLQVTIDSQNVMPYTNLKQDGRNVPGNSGSMASDGPVTLQVLVTTGEYTLWLSPRSQASGTIEVSTRMVSGEG